VKSDGACGHYQIKSLVDWLLVVSTSPLHGSASSGLGCGKGRRRAAKHVGLQGCLSPGERILKPSEI
jgi:hypothetical protein